MQGIGQLVSVIAVGRLVYENFYRSKQCAVTRKPDSFVRPESAIVEMDNFGEGVEAPPMGIAGEVAELFQFAKYGDVGVGAQCALQLGQISDLVPAEILAQDGGLERGRPHNVIVHTPRRE